MKPYGLPPKLRSDRMVNCWPKQKPNRAVAKRAAKQEIEDRMSQKEWNLEDVYDEQIVPLMVQILKICKKHQMPMVASFEYRSKDGDGDLCTSALLEDEWNPSKQLVAGFGMIRNGFVAATIRTKVG